MELRLSELVGQQVQRAALGRLLGQDRVGHAMLFEGPEGVGKTTIAGAVAASLACLQPRVDGDACCGCRSCRALERGEHPDVARLERQGREIKIDQVRDATARLRYDPVLGRAKVLLVLEADRLREEAANALLKTLEEPSSRTHFVLVSSRPQLLLHTIRSRCQTLRFGPLAEEDLMSILERKLSQRGDERDRSLLRLGAALADGSLSAARVRSDPAWQPVVEAVVDEVASLGTRPFGHEVGFVESLQMLLAQAPMPRDDDEAGEATATTRGGKADADIAGADKAGADKAGADKAGGDKRSKGLDRDTIVMALDLVRAALRDAALIASGVDPSSLPHARWAGALGSLAARAGTEPLLASLDEIAVVEANLVYNPSSTLAMEALLASMSRHVRRGR